MPPSVARSSTSLTSWMLSQFLHGEQGALFAAAQVTEAVQFFDGKLYGATQVIDEGRHVEVFHRYLEDKLGKLYQINDNLFVIIDALMSDARWDMKFLGMQIMVEGLALGAFGTLYKLTKEPLLKELLKMVIQDEARHVHYGVLALREHITKELSRERAARARGLGVRGRAPHAQPLHGLRDLRGVVRGSSSRARSGATSCLRTPGLEEFRSVDVPAPRAEPARDRPSQRPRIMPRYEPSRAHEVLRRHRRPTS